ncbi:hypothetical protein ACO1O0_005585 [Amphichorda felina]
MDHVIDHALSKPGEESYHEVHKTRYLETTRLPTMLARHGINQKVFEEELFPLVEMPSPQLCADRLDYALRDAVGFGKLTMEVARRVVGSLKAFPSSTAAHRLLVLDDPHVALILSRAYIAIDNDVWSNPAHIDMYQRTGQNFGICFVEQRILSSFALWRDWKTKGFQRTTDSDCHKVLKFALSIQMFGKKEKSNRHHYR